MLSASYTQKLAKSLPWKQRPRGRRQPEAIVHCWWNVICGKGPCHAARDTRKLIASGATSPRNRQDLDYSFMETRVSKQLSGNVAHWTDDRVKTVCLGGLYHDFHESHL